MNLRKVNPSAIQVKSLYVSFLIIMALVMSLLSACNKEEAPTPVQEPTSTSQADEDKLIHKVPQIPVILDGVAAAPEEVSKYNGKPLFYVLDEKSVQEGVIRIFTDEQQATAYRQQVEAQTALPSPVDKGSRIDASEGFTAKVTVYTEGNYGGSSYTFDLGNTDLYDLRKVNCIVGICWNLDNQISSIKCAQMPKHWTVLFSSIAYQGSIFWIAPGVNRAYLSTYGWNDRASSIGFVPYSLHQ